MKNLNAEAGQMHPNSDEFNKLFWKNYYLNLTQSQERNYSSMILYELLPSKLLTKEHYKEHHIPGVSPNFVWDRF